MKSKYAIYKNELYKNVTGDDNVQHLVTFNNLIAKPQIKGYHNVNLNELSLDVTKSQIITWFLVKYSSTLVLSVAVLAILLK